MPCHTRAPPPALRVAPEASKKQRELKLVALSMPCLFACMLSLLIKPPTHSHPHTGLYTLIVALPSSLCQDPLSHLLRLRTRWQSSPSLLKLCFPPTLETAAMASVRLPPLLLALVLAVVLALLLPSAQAFFPQQLSSSSSLMKPQHQYRPGTNRGTQG